MKPVSPPEPLTAAEEAAFRESLAALKPNDFVLVEEVRLLLATLDRERARETSRQPDTPEDAKP